MNPDSVDDKVIKDRVPSQDISVDLIVDIQRSVRIHHTNITYRIWRVNHALQCKLDIKFAVIIIPCYAMIILAISEDLYTCNYPYLSEIYIYVTKKVAPF